MLKICNEKCETQIHMTQKVPIRVSRHYILGNYLRTLKAIIICKRYYDYFTNEKNRVQFFSTICKLIWEINT